jgi:hypothetical protein
MRIFTKKSFGFRIPGSKNATLVRTQAMAFNDVPDWVGKDPMFRAGCESGDIDVMASPGEEIKFDPETSTKNGRNRKKKEESNPEEDRGDTEGKTNPGEPEPPEIP